MRKTTFSAATISLFLLMAVCVTCSPASAQVQTTTEPPSASGSNAKIEPAGAKKPDPGGFFHRFSKAYWDDWTVTSSDPDVPRRGYPAPVASPPYPFSDWPYGGSPVIGAPDTSVGPLMSAIYSGEHGKSWQDSRIKIYGWVNGGFNVSTSDKHYGNSPAAYYIQPNSVQFDQGALYIERLPDTVQNDHFDWGFRLTQLYGLDYRFTTAKGYLSQQLLTNNNDIKGQRTGFKTQYSEHLIGWGHRIGSTILIRPELRYEHSYDTPAYNLGTKKNQLVFASDIIFHF